jgi:lysophospholipase L1-like esterase
LLFIGFVVHAQAPPAIADMLARGEPIRIVCFGDSITGVYYHTGGKRAYPEMLEIALKRIYPKAKVQVVNAGISGHNTRHALARIDRDVLKHKPHLVTVMFGMNDLVGVPLAEFKANMEKIIARCREAKARVMLCTQNAVLENAGRPNKKLDEFTRAIRDIAREHKLAVADCNQTYLDVRDRDAREFRLLMSDEIHPNMDGHKLLAEVIARTISGKAISLADVPTPRPAIPRTLSLLKAGKPVTVLAMAPYDKLIGPALKTLKPDAKVEVATWPTEGQSLAQIEQHAKKVRKMGMDLVIIAVPLDAKVASDEELIRSFSWVMNWSLSFARQEWDCIAIPPSTATPKLTAAQRRRDQHYRRLIRAQHIDTIIRELGDERPIREVLVNWLKEQAK